MSLRSQCEAAGLTYISKVQGQEERRPDVRMRAVDSPAQRTPGQQGVLKILSERTTQSVRDLRPLSIMSISYDRLKTEREGGAPRAH